MYVEKIKVKVYVNQGKSLSHACIDDALSPQLNLTVDPTLQKQRDRDTVRKLLQMRNCPKVKNTSRKANAIRDHIMKYLWIERKNVQLVN